MVGRNGSGKSTLLRIAAGLVQPDAGYRFVQPGATIRYLPQEPHLSWQRDYSNQFCLNQFKKHYLANEYLTFL